MGAPFPRICYGLERDQRSEAKIIRMIFTTGDFLDPAINHHGRPVYQCYDTIRSLK